MRTSSAGGVNSSPYRALWLLLACACVTTSDSPPGAPPVSSGTVHTVEVAELPDGRLRLSYPLLPAEMAPERFSEEEARATLAEFREGLARLDPRLLRKAAVAACAGDAERMGGTYASGVKLAASLGADEPSPLERALREQFIERYGEPRVPLPRCLEQSALVMALRLAPRHLAAGVREGAEKLFADPAFLAGIATALVVYVIAWAAPEPIFTKGFAASVTLLLTWTFRLSEIAQLGVAALRLYQDTQGARTLADIETAAERFGKSMGEAGVRIMAFVAMRGIGKEVRVPQAGLWKLLPPRRFALPGGGTLTTATQAQAVTAEGVLVVAGASAGSGSAAVRRVCIDLPVKAPGYTRHHLATNKNDVSDVRGGPWTPLFEDIFAQAGMGLDDLANQVNLFGHVGPHPKQYHQEIYKRLLDAVRGCTTQQQCRVRLLGELRKIADEVCTQGSRLHRLVTK